MTRQTASTLLVVLAATIAALSLGPSFAHVLEAPPRMTVWSPELWREATVFNGQFILFAVIGAPLDIAAVVLPAALAYVNRDQPSALAYSIAATLAFAFALAIWFSVVAPANSVLASWIPGPVPADFDDVRWRWETGHMGVAATKLIGFVLLMMAIASFDRSRGPSRDVS
jgi:hypothetical protein